ncbi:MAG: FeoB-associated Cys-rich membrane protein [Spirochaetes bacterium]|uniref:FeoB-associated Cys-rich membrane protein n=1 Tax=Candidatus Ornithospirochaeta stercoripullorum TaxID=2840899 RepID=A0A9D9E2V4_9SPIO|nr:FeoB-associated Cys-rich membrane protein [Candidatus Ornithospirochaeta stercoripullorum]
MADIIILALVFAYSVFLVARMLRRRRKGIAGCGCSGSCATCHGCSAGYIDKLIAEAKEKADGR